MGGVIEVYTLSRYRGRDLKRSVELCVYDGYVEGLYCIASIPLQHSNSHWAALGRNTNLSFQDNQ